MVLMVSSSACPRGADTVSGVNCRRAKGQVLSSSSFSHTGGEVEQRDPAEWQRKEGVESEWDVLSRAECREKNLEAGDSMLAGEGRFLGSNEVKVSLVGTSRRRQTGLAGRSKSSNSSRGKKSRSMVE